MYAQQELFDLGLETAEEPGPGECLECLVELAPGADLCAACSAWARVTDLAIAEGES